MPQQEEIAKMMSVQRGTRGCWDYARWRRLSPDFESSPREWSNGTPSVTDGPFAETREVIGGYWIWEVGSRRGSARMGPTLPDEGW